MRILFFLIVVILWVPTKRSDLQVLSCLKAEPPQGQETAIYVLKLVWLIFPEPGDTKILNIEISETWSPEQSRRMCSDWASALKLWQNEGFAWTRLCLSRRPPLERSNQSSSFSPALHSSAHLDLHQACLQAPSSSHIAHRSRRSPIGWLFQKSWLLVVVPSAKFEKFRGN